VFESIARWFDSLERESRLFENGDDEVLHSALASVLYHLISADSRVSQRERRRFDAILHEEFGLADEQVSHLYERASATAGDDPLEDLRTINQHLRRNPVVRMEFLRKLLHVISIDGTREEELDVFYNALREDFPDLGT
jgi:uncharacterized tellurite resistance protein B-like protein